MNLFYTPDINSELYTLNEEESKHCVRVLRMAIGDSMYLIDGKGGMYVAQIIDDRPKACVVKIIESKKEYGKRPIYLHIAIAPTKNIDRFEWFLEKATEIGIDEITPLLCENSERKIIKNERIEKVVVAAMKQSYKAYMPRLNDMCSFEEFISNNKSGTLCIAHCEDSEKMHITEACGNSSKITILIGPEGDFSIAEINKALSSKYKAITLSESRLRTETAGVVACSAVNLIHKL